MLASPDAAGARRGRAAPVLVGRRGAAGRDRRALHARTSAARSSTASARPRCCTSSCRTGPATCATAPPASRCRATRSSCAATTAGRSPTARSATCTSSGPSAALMYWGNREKSRDDLPGRAGRKSGDKYVRDADGYYTYAGRSDDMLKVSGIYVSPFEVEATLMQHPAVLEAAVIGMADAEGLTKTKAFVVLQARAAQARRGRAEGLRQGPARAVQVPARDRVRRRAAEDGDRQDPALQAARARGGGAARRREPSTASSSRVDWRGPRRPHRVRSGSAPSARRAPLIVFLHEGLGSLAMWKDFPARLCDAAGCAASSTRAPATAARRRARADERWALDFMHRQAHEVLPALLDALRRRRGADRLAVRPQRRRLDRAAARRALPAARGRRDRAGAAHLRRGPVGREHRAGARRLPRAPTCAQRLARYHDDPDSAFWGWNDIWLHPPFRALEDRGRDRARSAARCWRCRAWTTSTARWSRSAASRAACRRPQLLELPDCGHSPHRDQPEARDRRACSDSSHARQHEPRRHPRTMPTTRIDTVAARRRCCAAGRAPLAPAQAQSAEAEGRPDAAVHRHLRRARHRDRERLPALRQPSRAASSAAARSSTSRSTTSPTRPRPPTTSTS